MKKHLTITLSLAVLLLAVILVQKNDLGGTPYNPLPPNSVSETTASSTSATTTNPITISTSSTATTTQTSGQAELNFNFGIAAGGGFTYLDQQDLMTQLEGIKKLGVGWVRFDFDWSAIQSAGPTSYNWKGYDLAVSDLNALGLKGLGIIDYTPQWARSSACPQSNKCAPADPAQFAAFAQTVVKRYAPQGMHTWEVWNEPNITDFWQPAPNITAYSTLLKDTYVAIKEQDPSAFVISAGLSRTNTAGGDISPIDFLTGLYANGAKGSFDAVALHPYTFPMAPFDTSPSNPWAQIANTTPSIRSIMVANGDANKKIWITEYGAPTGGVDAPSTPTNESNPDHVTEAFQAEMIAEAITSVKSMSFAGPLFIYTYSDSVGSSQYNENFFGVVRTDGSTKPAYTTIKDMISE